MNEKLLKLKEKYTEELNALAKKFEYIKAKLEMITDLESLEEKEVE